MNKKKEQTLPDPARRDFLGLTVTAVGVAGVAATAWPLLNTMNPAADTLALATIEVDLSPLKEGESLTVEWRGKPVFIRHRTKSEIEQANDVNLSALRDPESDADRIQNPKWLVLVGVCTHLGCIPGGQKPGEKRGDYDGWQCACHGSHYDTSGRIRKGPAPKNLEVPQYVFIDDNRIQIG